MPIDKHDAAIGSLRGLISSLQTQTAVLESTISSLDAKARLALKSKNRITAMSALRSKKLAESRLQARSDVLINLGKVYSQIEAASDQVAAVRIMETSTSVLQSLHAKVGGVEGVEAVVDALADEMAKVEDVNRVVNEAGAGAEAADEVEVEEELAALEREERQAIEQADAKARTQAAELAADRAAERTQQRLAELPRVANVSIEGPEPSESSARTAAITEKIARVSLDK